MVVNLLFGVIAGLQPLFSGDPRAALVQLTTVLVLQVAMCVICFYYLPDADRLISRFAGTQFAVESLSTATLLITRSGATISSPDFGLEAVFVLSITAMCVPMVQLLEQRLVTPIVNVCVNKGGSPIVLLAAAYMLAYSLPKHIMAMVTQSASNPDAAGSASAGDAEDEHAGSGQTLAAQPDDGPGDGGECDDGEMEGSCSDGDEDESGPKLSTGAMGDSAMRGGRLLARALAAKEVAVQKHAIPQASAPVPSSPRASAPMPSQSSHSRSSFASTHALARLKRRQTERRLQREQAVADDGGADDVDETDAVDE